MTKISAFHSPSVRTGELGDVQDGGRLRYMHGKVDTTISCTCTISVGYTQCSGCGLWPWCYGCHLSVIITGHPTTEASKHFLQGITMTMCLLV